MNERDIENSLVSHGEDWEDYDSWTEPEPEHDPDGDELRQSQLDESLFDLVKDMSHPMPFSVGGWLKEQA